MDHRIWRLLEHQGRSLKWLALRTGFSEALVKSVKAGRRSASPLFRERCALALDEPESDLFHNLTTTTTESEPAEAVA